MFDDLYNTDILALSASLRNERLDAPCGTARQLSKLCGSWVEVDLEMAGDIVTECALRVQACALGQASAAILKSQIVGATKDEIRSARDALESMLKESGLPPEGRFEQLALLSGVKDYPARHASTLLAFNAAVAAMDDCGMS